MNKTHLKLLDVDGDEGGRRSDRKYPESRENPSSRRGGKKRSRSGYIARVRERERGGGVCVVCERGCM